MQKPALNAKELAAILSDVWLIDSNYAISMQELLPNILNGSYAITANNDKPFRVDAAANPSANGEVLIVPINGPMMKYDYCGSPGTATMADVITQAQTDSSIKSIVLSIDSPGGSVSGTEELARTVAISKKPVVTYTHGMMASAAYWVGSQASQVIINGRTSMVGSIGTMAMIQKTDSERNIVVFADRSTRKNRSMLKASEGDTADYVNEILNPLNDAFEASVSRSRAGKIDLAKEDVLTGAMYIGNKAIKVGLADKAGSFQYAVKQSLQINSKMENNKFTAVQQAAKVVLLQQIEEGYVFDEEAMQNIEEALAAKTELETELATAILAHTDAEAELAKTATELIAAEKTIAALQTENAALKQLAPALEQTPKAGADVIPGTAKTGWDKYRTSADDESDKQKALLAF